MLPVSSFSDMLASRRNPDIGKAFEHRILLAVTEVNGCRMCSYYHTQKAFEAGVPSDEINQMMGQGDFKDAPPEEALALAFAQHYAERAGAPDPAAWGRLGEVYGAETARHILAIIRMISVGNLIGNMVDAFSHRLKGKPVEGSHLSSELALIIGGPLYMIVRLIGKQITGRPKSNLV